MGEEMRILMLLGTILGLVMYLNGLMIDKADLKISGLLFAILFTLLDIKKVIEEKETK